VLRLLDFVVFNALIGNHDAHAKNFSLLYASRGVTLAPLYDALSTAIYPELTDKMAMKIGSKYRFTEVLARHWDGFAEAAGLSPAQTRRRVVQLAQKIPSSAKQLQQDWASQGKDSPVVASIVTLIGERSALTLRRLTSSEA
jgi:serine/threonine-protein kinase HipA